MSEQAVQPNDTTERCSGATAFLEALFGQAPGDQFLEIREIDGAGKVHQTFHPMHYLKAHGFENALPMKSDGLRNIYYGVAPRVTRRGQARDVTAVGVVWFDEITRAAPNLPPFSFMVETSPGKAQGGYFLIGYTSDLDRVNNLNKRLAAVVGGDNVGDMPRVLRLPDFQNVKYEHKPRTYLSEFHPDRRYTLDQLDAALPPLPPKQTLTAPNREYDGNFNPHWGTPLADQDQTKLTLFLADHCLRLGHDGRFVGSCPFDHGCDCDSAFYCSPITGTWTCFCSDHVGKAKGGVRGLRKLGLKVRTPIAPQDDLEGEHTSTVSSRWAEIYAYKNKFRSNYAELFPIGSYGEQFNILMENPDDVVSKERLQELLSLVTGPGDSLRLRIDECGRRFGLDCPEHGERGQSVRTCKTQFHADCPTKTASKLAQCALPDREGEQSYREVWLETSVILDVGDLETVLKAKLDQWAAAVPKVARRKAYKGKILHRSYSVYLDQVSRLRWKVMFLEDAVGDSDDAVEQLCDAMNAIVVGDIRYHRGESALLQLMVDASCTLAGMAEDNPEWFSAYFYATKGRHAFESMGAVYHVLREVPKSEKPVCDVQGCGLPLIFKPIFVGAEVPVDHEEPPPREGPTQGQLSGIWS